MRRIRVGDWLFVLASLWVAIRMPGTNGADPAALGERVGAFVLTYATPLLAYLVLRTVSVHFVLQSMMKRAPGQVVEADEKIEGASAALAPIRFFEVDSAKGVLLSDSYQDRLERALTTGRRTLSIFWASLLTYAVTGAIVLYTYFHKSDRQADSPIFRGSATPVDFGTAVWTGAGVLACAAIGLGLLAAVATVTTRYRSIGRVSLLSSTGCLALQATLAVGVGRALGLPWYVYALPPFGAALIMIGGYLRIRRAVCSDGNVRLLILRVFGADRNTAFVFGPLMQSWRFLGAFFTIVDPSYIRFQFSLSSSETRWKLLRVLALVGLTVGALSWVQYGLFEIVPLTNPALVAWADLDEGQQHRLLGMTMWLVLTPMAILPVVRTVRSRFVRSSADLERRIRRGLKRSVGLSGMFSGFPMYCYDNVWKQAVHSLLPSADVVLMDLRGYSPERSGCEYEIGVLFDRYPIQQIVFLVDPGDVRDAVYHTIRGVWANLKTTSLNSGLESPIVKVYAPTGDEGRDVTRILALLVASALTAGDGRGTLASFEEGQSRHRVEPSRRRSRSWSTVGVRVGEAVDAALATPRYARVVIPLLIAAVVGMFYMSARPGLAAYGEYSRLVTVTPSSPAPIATISPSDPPSTVAAPGLSDGSAASDPPVPLPAAQRDVNLHANATASVSDSGGYAKGRSYSNPLEIIVDLTGGAAADALRFGHVKLDPVVTDTGDSLELLSMEGGRSGDNLQQEFVVIDRTERDFFTKEPKHPEDGLRLKLRFFKPQKEFARVKALGGTAIVQTMDPDKTVRLENLGSRASERGIIRLQHPKLDDIGEFSLTFRDAEHVQLVVKGARLPDFDARLVDAAGGIVPSTGKGTLTWGGTTTKDFDFAMDKKSLRTARLEIFLGYKSFVAPFSFTNVVVKK